SPSQVALSRRATHAVGGQLLLFAARDVSGPHVPGQDAHQQLRKQIRRAAGRPPPYVRLVIDQGFDADLLNDVFRASASRRGAKIERSSRRRSRRRRSRGSRREQVFQGVGGHPVGQPFLPHQIVGPELAGGRQLLELGRGNRAGSLLTVARVVPVACHKNRG